MRDFLSLRSWRLEVVGAIRVALPFFLVPTSSKRQLGRVDLPEI